MTFFHLLVKRWLLVRFEFTTRWSSTFSEFECCPVTVTNCWWESLPLTVESHNFVKKTVREHPAIASRFHACPLKLSGFPGSSSGEEATCQCSTHKIRRLDSWVGKIPWRRAWQTAPVFLPGESHGQRSLVGYSPSGCKELDTTEAT